MPKIRIIKTPPSQAPEWVRQKWVGLELPIVVSPETGVQFGTLGGEPQNLGGFHIPTQQAIEILKQKSPEAAKWWEENALSILADHLVFSREVCQLIE